MTGGMDIFSAGALISFSEEIKFKPSVMAKYNLSGNLRLDGNGSMRHFHHHGCRTGQPDERIRGEQDPVAPGTRPLRL